MEYNHDKFSTLIHYIISKGSLNGAIPESLVFKLAYFSDFNYYGEHQIPITGETYIREEYGPKPVHFDEIIKELNNDGKIEIKEDKIFGDLINNYYSLINPNTDLFSLDELKLIDVTIENSHNIDSKVINDDNLLYSSSEEIILDYGDIRLEDTPRYDIIYYYPTSEDKITDDEDLEFLASIQKAWKQVEDGDCESMDPDEFLEELDSL